MVAMPTLSDAAKSPQRSEQSPWPAEQEADNKEDDDILAENLRCAICMEPCERPVTVSSFPLVDPPAIWIVTGARPPRASCAMLR